MYIAQNYPKPLQFVICLLLINPKTPQRTPLFLGFDVPLKTYKTVSENCGPGWAFLFFDPTQQKRRLLANLGSPSCRNPEASQPQPGKKGDNLMMRSIAKLQFLCFLPSVCMKKWPFSPAAQLPFMHRGFSVSGIHSLWHPQL